MADQLGSGSMRAVADEVAALWPASGGRVPQRLSGLPAWSTVFTHRGLMFCPISAHDDALLGVGACALRAWREDGRGLDVAS